MPTGQQLGDLFASAAGANVNRPQLNAFVANSQAINGLRSAQTEDALLNAQRAQDEQEASSQLESALISAGTRPADARVMALSAKMHAGSATNAMDMFKAYNASVLGDPSKLGTPDQTAAQQALTGKVAEPVAVPSNYATLPGAYQPQVKQTEQGQAQTANLQAQAALRDLQTTHPQLFHPSAMGGQELDPNVIAFESYKYYHIGKMPPLGMGNAPLRAAIMGGAANLAQREANGEDVRNPAFDQAIANGQDYLGAQRAIGNFAGGPLGNQTRSINNVVGHLQLMENLFNGLQNGDVQLVNSLRAKWKQAFGSEVPTDIQTASGFIGPELTKILSANSSAGTVDERQEFSHVAANLANAPEQTAGAIHTLKGMLGRQLTDLALQYHGATGRGDFTRRYVAPDVAQYLDVAPQGGAAPQTGAPSVAAPAAAPAGAVPLDQFLKSKGF
jgi:hypothetical protein